jgi:hypothetical protein
MIEYVMLGTSHCIQDSLELDKPVRDAISTHAIRLIAEEYPHDSASRVCVTAKRLHIPYLQIDLYPDEQIRHNIDQEIKKREEFFRGTTAVFLMPTLCQKSSGWKGSRRVWITARCSLSAATSI